MNLHQKDNIQLKSDNQNFDDRYHLDSKIPIQKIAYILCISTGIIIMISWFIGYERALSIFEGSATMKFNTALVFLLIGLNLFLLHRTEFFRKTIYNLISITIIIIGFLSILSNYDFSFFNIDDIFGIDIFSKVKPGLMSAATATCALLIALGFIFIKSNKSIIEKLANKLFLTVNLISLVSIISYFLLISSEKKAFFLKTMAIHTSVIFYLVSIVLLLKNPKTIIHKMLYGKHIGSEIFKKIIPNIVLIPIILSNVLLIVIDKEVISFDFGLNLLVLTLIILSLLYISYIADSLNNADQKRIELENKLLKNNKKLKMFKQTIDDSSAMLIIDRNFNIKYANSSLCNLSMYKSKELIGVSNEILHQDLNPTELMENRLSTIQKGNIWSGVLKIKAKDGSILKVKTNVIPFQNKKGEITEYIITKNNITHIKKA